MSTSANARTAAESHRRLSAASGAKFRAPSSRLGARDRPLSSGDVIPEDSASNGPHRRSASGAQKPNGSGTYGGKLTGRVHLTTRDNLQTRNRSPAKIPGGDGAKEPGSRDRGPTPQSSRAFEEQIQQPKREKKAQREFRHCGGDCVSKLKY